MRYFIELAYKGTDYHGWQVQPNAVTIQSVLEDALATILRRKTSLTGAGRTDSGVHASYFTAHFDIPTDPGRDIVFRLNGYLPLTIRVFRVLKVPARAHARFDALSRTYRYVIHTTKHPFVCGLSTYSPKVPDLQILNEASAFLKTCIDFTTFSKLHSNNKTNLCRIDQAYWEHHKSFIVFTITADRFLRNMVRSLTGTLLDTGRSKISIDAFKEIVKSRDRSRASSSAPPEGLYLTDIRYPEQYGMLNTGRDEILPFAW